MPHIASIQPVRAPQALLRCEALAALVVGLFLRSSPEFRKTDWIGDSSTGISGVTVNTSAAFVTLLKNPDTGAGFYVLRQNDSTST